MQEPIPYSLKAGHPDSQRYYATIVPFADEVLARAQTLRALLERSGSPDEKAFELLLLGTLWRIYGQRAQRLGTLPRLALEHLGRWREQSAWKSSIDPLRGVLGTLCLHPFASRGSSEPSLLALKRLLGWLSATGEYKQEVKRFQEWARHWENKPNQTDAEDDLEAILAFASWFEDRSEQVLGEWTEPLEGFLRQRHPHYRWREDAIACGRIRVEYHANLVGAELLNRAYREEFALAPHKEVLLPACMCHRAHCQAKPSRLGLRCAGCAPDCRIHQVTQLGQKHGFGVIVMRHQSGLFEGWQPGETAIVGVACVPTLIGGGWKARSMQLPAQCVLLDHCGCRQHWHREGIETDLNLEVLKKILGIPGRLAESA